MYSITSDDSIPLSVPLNSSRCPLLVIPMYNIQWNLYIVDTIGNHLTVLILELSVLTFTTIGTKPSVHNCWRCVHSERFHCSIFGPK